MKSPFLLQRPLNEQGFVTNFLVTPRTEEPFGGGQAQSDQLAYEKYLRTCVADAQDIQPSAWQSIRLGQNGPTGTPWRYYSAYGNWFVDDSTFYPLLRKVRLDAATILCCAAPCKVKAILWSYSAVKVWLNEKLQGEIQTPVYKPISRQEMTLDLQAGENTLYFCLQTLGVRDTRTLFGFQILEEAGMNLCVSLPDAEHVTPVEACDRWLSSVCRKNRELVFPDQAPCGTTLVYDSRPLDFEHRGERYTRQDITGCRTIELSDKTPYLRLEIQTAGQTLSRNFEQQELLHAHYNPETDMEKNKERVYRRIATVGAIPRGDNDRFALYPILARRHNGTQRPQDIAEILHALDQIESRRDCSDFLTCALVRFLKIYDLPPEITQRAREVLLNYRYWMDENGSDGMCFWSENHSLMFFVSACVAGQLYPEDIFARSGKTGKQVQQLAEVRIQDWLDDANTFGFAEFNSGGYTPITFASLLNVVDFCNPVLSEAASRAADRLLHDLAVQTFDGVCVSPQGRVYREVLYPFAQDIQSLVNLLDPEAPDRSSEWVIFLATSRYQLPVQLAALMKQNISTVYEQGNGRICVEKNRAYILTSVESPRTDGVDRRWENISRLPEADKGCVAYTRSLNENFHGTTRFGPGVPGYQQHLWYAALDAETCVFTNHPGGTCDSTTMRPGYWFGNGSMPALHQSQNALFIIYKIGEENPIGFTHLYWPAQRFEETLVEQGWRVGKKKNGYLGIWCSEAMVPWDDQLAGCEYRAYSRNHAYYCVCADNSRFSTLADFARYCVAQEVHYLPEEKTLLSTVGSLTYHRLEDSTQIV